MVGGVREMKTNMPQVRAAFVSQHDAWPWKRQLPTGTCCVEDFEFFVPPGDAEVVFVYDALPCARLDVPASALRVFVCSEPENVKRYNSLFLAQFDLVITADRQTPHPNKVFVQAGLPWHAGSMTDGGVLLAEPMQFEDFEKHDPVKTRLVSVVSSNKVFTEEHRVRLAFVEKLKEALGDQVDVFGRGIADFADKRDVLDSYRYHIALENCAIRDYWTEKLADPFLTLTFPIYHGCPNVLDYFSEGALRQIDIYKPDEAVAAIKDIIDSDLAERSRAELLEARRRVMYEHNVFALLAHTARRGLGNLPQDRSTSTGTMAIRWEAAFAPTSSRWRNRVINALGAVPYLRTSVRAVKRLVSGSVRTPKRVK